MFKTKTFFQFENQCHTVNFGKRCMIRLILSSFVWHYREWLCVCITCSPGAWWHCGWLMCTSLSPYGQLIVALFLFASLPDYWMQWQTGQLCKRKQFWEGRRDEEEVVALPIMLLALPCFLSMCQSAMGNILMCVCPFRSCGLALRHSSVPHFQSSLLQKHPSSEHAHIHAYCTFLNLTRKHRAVMLQKVT